MNNASMGGDNKKNSGNVCWNKNSHFFINFILKKVITKMYLAVKDFLWFFTFSLILLA